MTHNSKFPLDSEPDYEFVLRLLFIGMDFERLPRAVSNFNMWLKTEIVPVGEGDWVEIL